MTGSGSACCSRPGASPVPVSARCASSFAAVSLALAPGAESGGKRRSSRRRGRKSHPATLAHHGPGFRLRRAFCRATIARHHQPLALPLHRPASGSVALGAGHPLNSLSKSAGGSQVARRRLLHSTQSRPRTHLFLPQTRRNQTFSNNFNALTAFPILRPNPLLLYVFSRGQ